MDDDSADNDTASGNASVFRLVDRDAETAARRGVLVTRRGPIQLPAFMPVGTQASVKSLSPEDVAATGSEIVLANTYHLMLRPGVEIIKNAGGLHRFMAWNRPILTDSGGFQIFSLAHRTRVSETGVEFRSHLDGSRHELTPERAIDLQLGFGSDIFMPLDHVLGYDSPPADQQQAMERTHRWLERAVRHFSDETISCPDSRRPLLFAIAQGGFESRRRRASASVVGGASVDGCAIGGLSVGEPKELMSEMLADSIAELPADKPRYLMGVGSPEDLWQAVALGVDMFDCVHPTRVARRGALFTAQGRLNVTAARFASDFGPIDASCDCLACQNFSAAYLHHLFRARELLAYRLATIHNLRFVQRVMEQIRASISGGTFAARYREFVETYEVADVEAAREQKVKWVVAREISRP